MTIQNCSANCGFKHSDLEIPDKADSENDVILEMRHVGNYEDYDFISWRKTMKAVPYLH
jgi:hypothetical protein